MVQSARSAPLDARPVFAVVLLQPRHQRWLDGQDESGRDAWSGSVWILRTGPKAAPAGSDRAAGRAGPASGAQPDPLMLGRIGLGVPLARSASWIAWAQDAQSAPLAAAGTGPAVAPGRAKAAEGLPQPVAEGVRPRLPAVSPMDPRSAFWPGVVHGGLVPSSRRAASILLLAHERPQWRITRRQQWPWQHASITVIVTEPPAATSACVSTLFPPDRRSPPFVYRRQTPSSLASLSNKNKKAREAIWKKKNNVAASRHAQT